MHGAEGVLKDPPRDRLAAARLPHYHRGVSGVFGLVQLNYLGHGEGGHLETAQTNLCLYSLFQLVIKGKKTCVRRSNVEILITKYVLIAS